MLYLTPITVSEILSRAKRASNVMHPNYIWPGLCIQIRRNPTEGEWREIIKDSPFIRKGTKP